MKIAKLGLARRLSSESGEVSIAWMFLTASLIAMSLAVLSVLGGGAKELANEMETEMENTEMGPHYIN